MHVTRGSCSMLETQCRLLMIGDRRSVALFRLAYRSTASSQAFKLCCRSPTSSG